MNWVRVAVTLPSHPKTHALAHLMDVPWQQALGMVVSVLAWAATREQEEIVLTNTEVVLLAQVAGYMGEGGGANPKGWPRQFVQLLLAAGFLDEVRPEGDDPNEPPLYRLHDWKEWNGAAIRQSVAARERMREHRANHSPNGSQNVRRTFAVDVDVDVTKTTTKTETDNNHLASVTPLPRPKPKLPSAGALEAGEVQVVWNEHRGKLPEWKLTAPKRAAAARAMLKAHGLERIAEAVKRAAASGFCTGGGNTGWRADPDWFCKPGSLERVLEGAYDDRRVERRDKHGNLANNVGTSEDFDNDPLFNQTSGRT